MIQFPSHFHFQITVYSLFFRELIRKHVEYEYKLVRREKSVKDFLEYINYKKDFLKLARIRMKVNKLVHLIDGTNTSNFSLVFKFCRSLKQSARKIVEELNECLSSMSANCTILWLSFSLRTYHYGKTTLIL